MSRVVEIRAGLGLPERSEIAPLARLVAARRPPRPTVRRLDLFGPELYRMSAARAYRALDPEARHALRARLAFAQLEEASFVERLGMALAAKMILLAESVEERELYAGFAADEARHLASIRGLLAAYPHEPQDNPFHALLADAVEVGDRPELALTLSAVLEGWGLVHYRGLAHSCRDQAVADLFRGVLRDEAAHHGAGVAIARSRPSRGAATYAWLSALCRMIQPGPVRVMHALEVAHGGLTAAQRVELVCDLDAHGHARAQLGLVAELLGRAGAGALADELEADGLLEPLIEPPPPTLPPSAATSEVRPC